jgi:heme-degrading monooxygenase HmoA
MLMCVIEFGTRPGMEERVGALLAELLVEAGRIDGFVSKESFLSRDRAGKTISVSYWRDDAALDTWMSNAAHRRAIRIGNQELFSHYTIQIARVVREKSWKAASSPPAQ